MVFVSIFPEIFNGFISTSIIAKSIEKGVLKIDFVNPRDFSERKHRQVDDLIYGGGDGMLLMAKPFIDAVDSVVKDLQDFAVIYLSPSDKFFTQQLAWSYSKVNTLVFVCGRYEGIDYRFEKYMEDKYGAKYSKISIGKYVLLGGEVASMVLAESIGRLVPGVVKELGSLENDSYNIDKNMKNIEFPQFTRPEEVYGMRVPTDLLSGSHKLINDWREKNEKSIGHIENNL
ncbi:MAG: tRNA (guanosine(37)-N1)-methyltransferase TrmD [Candidatus Absconditabacteria bacterium]